MRAYIVGNRLRGQCQWGRSDTAYGTSLTRLQEIDVVVLWPTRHAMRRRLWQHLYLLLHSADTLHIYLFATLQCFGNIGLSRFMSLTLAQNKYKYIFNSTRFSMPSVILIHHYLILTSRSVIKMSLVTILNKRLQNCVPLTAFQTYLLSFCQDPGYSCSLSVSLGLHVRGRPHVNVFLCCLNVMWWSLPLTKYNFIIIT